MLSECDKQQSVVARGKNERISDRIHTGAGSGMKSELPSSSKTELAIESSMVKERSGIRSEKRWKRKGGKSDGQEGGIKKKRRVNLLEGGEEGIGESVNEKQ